MHICVCARVCVCVCVCVLFRVDCAACQTRARRSAADRTHASLGTAGVLVATRDAHLLPGADGRLHRSGVSSRDCALRVRVGPRAPRARPTACARVASRSHAQRARRVVDRVCQRRRSVGAAARARARNRRAVSKTLSLRQACVAAPDERNCCRCWLRPIVAHARRRVAPTPPLHRSASTASGAASHSSLAPIRKSFATPRRWSNVSLARSASSVERGRGVGSVASSALTASTSILAGARRRPPLSVAKIRRRRRRGGGGSPERGVTGTQGAGAALINDPSRAQVTPRRRRATR